MEQSLEGRESSHHVPECDDLGLFFSLVPHAWENEKTRLTDSFENAEQRSQSNKCGKALRNGVE